MNEQQKNPEGPEAIMIDPTEYGYEQGQGITIDGQFFTKLMEQIQAAYNDEVDVKYSLNVNSDQEFFTQEQIVTTTPKGRAFMMMLIELSRVHQSNINIGLAKPFSELNKVKVEEVTK